MARIIKGPVVRTGPTRAIVPGREYLAVSIESGADVVPARAAEVEMRRLVDAEVARQLELMRADVEGRARLEGYQAGFDEGRAAGTEVGRQAGEQAWAGVVERASGAMDSMSQAVAQEFVHAQDIAVKISYEVVARILGDQLASPQAIAACVAQVAKSLPMHEVRAIRLNTEDLQLLEKAGLTGALSASGLVRLVAAEDVRLGGCIVETDREKLDARIETQLALLDQAIKAARGRLTGDQP